MATSINKTESALVKTGFGKIRGIFVASVSGSPTIKLWDSLTAANEIIINTFIPVAGTMYYFGSDGIDFATGLYLTIGGTVDCTLLID